MDERPPFSNDDELHYGGPDFAADREPDWLDVAEGKLIAAAIPLAPELGWNERLVDAAFREAQIGRRERKLVAPGGARDLAALLSRRHDRRALKALAKIDASSLKIRERIHAAVEARIEAAMVDEAAVRRANGFLALPLNVPFGLRLAWESADHLWRWAGDTATDENHYSKRAILSGVLISTLAARLSGGRDYAKTHLGQRIEQVMGFEKWKARMPKPLEAGESMAAWLGKARYGAREKLKGHHDAHVARGAETAPTEPGEA